MNLQKITNTGGIIMKQKRQKRGMSRAASLLAVVVVSALIGGIGGHVLAQMKGPTEHKGITVTKLGQIDEDSMLAQIGLKGYILRLRAATIEPGGYIKEHSHATRPGLVKVISGTWIEGRPDGEYEFKAGEDTIILEHKDTVHWFYNRGNEPATALVFDIGPSK
jgi:quercetin dioxygenase-like cupin family protein